MGIARHAGVPDALDSTDEVRKVNVTQRKNRIRRGTSTNHYYDNSNSN